LEKLFEKCNKNKKISLFKGKPEGIYNSTLYINLPQSLFKKEGS
jgi:hypothetical protein